ncbi:MAG: DEAD/DEAH box helicase [Gemmatimonadetes bacterium]|uniref:RNA helicase n=1 Tax=Candidatus Kutchimonas denitrificans TaxID=3056748 RepID=A0AAE5CCW0_9BACT|nr:DEAD/DEAH box helicase [Gemmatimonadota bacterium]NIR74729.1 DEAD/DEAH box helicase [Candidatus Kutchimonas denitrificans]NIS01479.1 DEAD/DEAH box helicase [Gemmatimonadota bacterium]NIT67220.1 DEAD/DEAH box helicase [Gemmatimonadota bacterium]NIU52394.1 DEAD/DEAH box helicase [Gemmatimonadota bacterium]
MRDFSELKLEPDLLARLTELGYTQPTAFQAEAVPTIARGTPAVGVASAGCGKTLAYGLGVAPRLDAGSPDLQALIIRPTDDSAARTADSLLSLVGARGLRVTLLQGDAPVVAPISVASPDAALAALQHSALKLDTVRVLIVDGLSAMVELGAANALETLTAQIPRDAQRVLLTGRLTPDVESWIDRHARRARQLTYIPPEPPPLGESAIEFWSGPRQAWIPALSGLLSSLDFGNDPVVNVHCRTSREAAELTDRLRVRGVRFASAPEEPGLSLEFGFPGPSPAGSISISWGSPPDYLSLHARVADSDRTVVFLEPRELPHLQRLAEAGRGRLTALRTTVPPEAARSAQHTRDQLRAAANERDLEPYVLLMGPLLDQLSPVQIAAAAIALLRERAPAPPEQPLPAWTRLYFNVGRRDGVRPADLVGAITGETSVTGEQIGRIEIRDTHTSVEVAAAVADQVIKGLATATIRGRPANVRLFRE